jgi:hypothetical protein
MEETCSFCPAMAVPTTVKIPEPMTAPIPREVRLNQPSDFFNRRSGSSASEINWSIFFTRNSPESTRHHPTAMRIEERGNSTLRGLSPQHRVLRKGGECAQRRSTRSYLRSSPAEIRVSLHELLGAVVGETDGELAVLAITLDTDNGSRAVGGVAHPLADERIRGGSRAPQAGLR